tara:strand:- start:595 stop:1152 length:558 start_codon:yes stop_codon:yes gene_type:complete
MKVDVNSFMKATDQFMELRDFWNSVVNQYNIENNRQRSNVLYRHIFSVLCYDLTNIPIVQIGSIIDRDHASVIHANKNHEHNRRYDKRYEDIYLSMHEKMSKLLTEYTKEREIQAVNRARKNNPGIDLDYMIGQVDHKWSIAMSSLEAEKKQLEKANAVYINSNKLHMSRISILESELKRIKNLI